MKNNVKYILPVSVFFVLVIILYTFRNPIFQASGFLIKPIVYKSILTEDFWSENEHNRLTNLILEPYSMYEPLNEKRSTARSLNTAESIHNFIEKYSLEIENIRNQYQERTSEEQNRKDLMEVFGIWNECWNNDDSVLLDKKLIHETNQINLYDVNIRICDSDLIMSGLLSIPNELDSAPLIVLIHGTAAGPNVLFDNFLEEIDYSERFDIEDYHHSAGSTLAENSYAIFAPQLITEKRTLPIIGSNQHRNMLHMRLLSLGFTLQGIELNMIKGSIDALLSDETIDTKIDKIGAYGVSLGGEMVFNLAALDQRINAVVVSQWIEDRDQKLFGSNEYANWNFTSSQYVYRQGFSRMFNDTEILRLILPRAVFVESGQDDIPRASVALKKFKNWESLFPDDVNNNRLCMEYGMGGHEALLNDSISWLDYHLQNEDDSSFNCLPNN